MYPNSFNFFNECDDVTNINGCKHIIGLDIFSVKLNEGKPEEVAALVYALADGEFKFLLPEFSQIIFSPGPLIFKLRKALKNFTTKDYLLLTGDPAIIGVACSIVSDMTNGRYNLLKWDKQERQYYPIEINLYEKGEIDDN